MQDPNCIFCKIVRGEIPSRKVYEDEAIFAFHDIHPVAPVHVLIVPKVHVPTMMEVEETHKDVLGAMMLAAPRIARELGSTDGFRLIVNSGRVGRQEVMHVHMHVVGGPEPLGPMIARARQPG
jgi:histidine triad (HIT) family protein